MLIQKHVVAFCPAVYPRGADWCLGMELWVMLPMTDWVGEGRRGWLGLLGFSILLLPLPKSSALYHKEEKAPEVSLIRG